MILYLIVAPHWALQKKVVDMLVGRTPIMREPTHELMHFLHYSFIRNDTSKSHLKMLEDIYVCMYSSPIGGIHA